jgi:hypothetical protein
MRVLNVKDFQAPFLLTACNFCSSRQVNELLGWSCPVDLFLFQNVLRDCIEAAMRKVSNIEKVHRSELTSRCAYIHMYSTIAWGLDYTYSNVYGERLLTIICEQVFVVAKVMAGPTICNPHCGGWSRFIMRC